MTTFAPIGNATLAVTSASSRVLIPVLNVPDLSGNNPPAKPYGSQVRFVTDADCFYKIGDSTVVATTSDTPLKSSVVEVFDYNQGGHTYIAAITATGTATLRITAGDGEEL